MRLATRVGLLCGAVGVASLGAGGGAAAAPKRITGNLSEPGYTVIALAANGKATAALAARGPFTLRPPASTVTLHLRDINGDYAGPIVVGRNGRRALLGARAGARLGRIVVRNGYARPARRPRRRWLDARRSARSRRGVPIGVRNFGHVRSPRARRTVPGDRDVDGIPDRLDIDDDGDLVLDKLDHSRRPRAAQDAEEDPFALASLLGPPLEWTENVNAGSSDGRINERLQQVGLLLMAVPQAEKVELNCGGTVNPSPPPPLVGGLPYCSYGGSGGIFPDREADRFPECCDPDADGYGTVQATHTGPGIALFQLLHHATTSEIGTDNLLTLVINDGQESPLFDNHEFIFATPPALVSYDDGAGNRATVDYPVDPGEPGTTRTGFPVADGPDDDTDVEVTVTFWRPQRRPTAQAECVQNDDPLCTQKEWKDIGGLHYNVASRGAFERGRLPHFCPQDSFVIPDPTKLEPGFPDPTGTGGGFRDLASDQPANRTNTITYEFNLTRCLARHGITDAFDAADETQTFDFQAFTTGAGTGVSGRDNAGTQISFTRR